MNKYPVLTLSALIASFGLAAVIPSGNNDRESSAINALSGNGFTVPEEKMAMPQQIGGSALVQRLINSGQFDPPPGNTDRLNSAVSPFSRIARTEVQGSIRKEDTNRPNQPGQALVGGNVSAHGTNEGTSAIAGPDNQSSNSQVLTQIQSQSPAFESPPGIGSAKGGQ